MSTPVILRPYQIEAFYSAQCAWDSGTKNVLIVLPTGAGKTVVFSEIIKEKNVASCAIAHRQELISQISIALARNGIYHRIYASQSLITVINKYHESELGRSFYKPTAKTAVATPQTLLNLGKKNDPWINTVRFWVMDEAHHLLLENQWGRAVSLFKKAVGLGVTATPLRADGAGLGDHADGVFHDMIVGPPMRELIDAGYLSDYRIIVPPSDVHMESVEISSSTGDYKKDQMNSALKRSHIVGDVVKHYLKFAAGLLGVTFASDVEAAEQISEQFNAHGVPAVVITGKTPVLDRARMLKKFKNREVLQLVSVDIFGEGFDLPAMEVASFARPTASYGLYVQQFGRPLRIMKGKGRAIIIDHVGNVMRHRLPDIARNWTLDRRERKKSGPSDAIPLRVCLGEGCFAAYERYLDECPECGTRPQPAERSAPKFVDGDLVELDDEVLAAMRAEVCELDAPIESYRAELQESGLPSRYVQANVKHRAADQEAQVELREAIAHWAGKYRAQGHSDSELSKRFYLTYGVDVLSAKALKNKEASKLTEKITW